MERQYDVCPAGEECGRGVWGGLGVGSFCVKGEVCQAPAVADEDEPGAADGLTVSLETAAAEVAETDPVFAVVYYGERSLDGLIASTSAVDPDFRLGVERAKERLRQIRGEQ